MITKDTVRNIDASIVDSPPPVDASVEGSGVCVVVVDDDDVELELDSVVDWDVLLVVVVDVVVVSSEELLLLVVS